MKFLKPSLPTLSQPISYGPTPEAGGTGLTLTTPFTHPPYIGTQQADYQNLTVTPMSMTSNSTVEQTLNRSLLSAASVGVSTASVLGAGPGASPRAALHELCVRPVALLIAKELLVRKHYLHSLPGGTRPSFGVFVGERLMGVLTFGVGTKLGHRLVEGAKSR